MGCAYFQSRIFEMEVVNIILLLGTPIMFGYFIYMLARNKSNLLWGTVTIYIFMTILQLLILISILQNNLCN